MRVWSAFLGGAVMAAAGFAVYPLVSARLPHEMAVLVGGQVPPEADGLEAWLGERARRIDSRQVTLLMGSGAIDVRFSELGLSLDVARSARTARLSSAPAGFFSALWRQIARRPEIYDVPLSFGFDARQASTRLTALKDVLYRAPLDARLDLALHARVPDVPGQELDLSGTLEQIARGDRDEGAVFQVMTRPVPARVTTEMLSQVEVERVLSSYETDFAHHAGPRAINIRTAARYLSGTVIAPGETFSFNRTVGPRTLERGFTYAPQIVAEELEPGVGGGVCQVASTLHAAAVFAGLEVRERRSHSRPSGYTPLGLDATVVDGELDLKLENPYPSALIVHAFLPTPTTLRVEFLGRDAPGKIEHFFTVKEKHEFMRRVVVEPSLEPNQSRRHQKGIWGYDVLSTVRTTYPNGQRHFRFYTSTYSPVPEVYWVGAGTDPSSLPPLPEGAQGALLLRTVAVCPKTCP